MYVSAFVSRHQRPVTIKYTATYGIRIIMAINNDGIYDMEYDPYNMEIMERNKILYPTST